MSDTRDVRESGAQGLGQTKGTDMLNAKSAAQWVYEQVAKVANAVAALKA